jgi:hypothetical protein
VLQEVDTTTAEEHAAFTFTYSELYPAEDKDSTFFKNNLNQENNEEFNFFFNSKNTFQITSSV